MDKFRLLAMRMAGNRLVAILLPTERGKRLGDETHAPHPLTGPDPSLLT